MFSLGEVGFLAEHRRINVAITRARRHLAVVADSETVSHDGFLKSLMEYMSSEGEVRSAHEYIQNSLPATVVDASNYHFENHQLFAKTSKADIKETSLEAKDSDTKGNAGLKAVINNESRTRSNEGETSAAKSDKVAQLDPPSSSHASAFSTKSSGFTESDRRDDFQDLRKPFPSHTTLAARYSRETLEKEIVDFTQDVTKLELPFPKSLNSYQRFDVHSIAEKLGLVHESRGEGNDRYIVVSKPKQAPKGLLLGLAVSLYCFLFFCYYFSDYALGSFHSRCTTYRQRKEQLSVECRILFSSTSVIG